MTSVQQFNGLNGRVVSRSEIEKILKTAKQENATDVVYRISKILNENPNTEEFEINIVQYPQSQGLAGARHTGDYREALDECGRLKKGWKFVGGNVVKVVKKEKSKKTDKKESKIKTPVVAHDKKRYGKVTKRERKEKIKKYTTAYFEKDLDYQTLYNAYHWNSFSPDKNAERDIKEWAKTMVSLYEAYTEQAQKSQVQEKYDATFDKWHQKLLALKKQIITQQSKTISTAVTGGAGVKQSQIKKNESAWKKISELNNTFLDTLEKAENELQKIAKNTPENEYESGEIIKSTDKFADDKIQQKIQTLQAFVERIKKSEKELKKASENQWETILRNNGFSEKETEEIITFRQRHGYFYLGKSTTNLNAEIRRLKQRLEHTEKIKTTSQENNEDKVTEFEGGKIVQNTEEMRLQIHFDEVPSAEIREALKKKAFKWSPKNKVWQRVLTRDAISVIDGLFKNGLFKKKIDGVKNAENITQFPLKDIYTDEKRFQNRKKLNETIVENIVKNFKETDLDPLVIWQDPKDKKYYLLAGHHRLEALKQLKKKTIPVKIANEDYPTEADAIRYAKEISNANRTLEEPYERAEIYRKDRENGLSQKEILEKAEIEGKNRNYVLNLSYLNPKGAVLQALIQFSQSQSKNDRNEMERIADWIGQARRQNEQLTHQHETEMLLFLKDKEASKRFSTKVQFLELVRNSFNMFEPQSALNLKRFKYQSEGEKVYNQEVSEIKSEIEKQQSYIDDLKQRFSNPLHKDFISPDDKDYAMIKKIADDKISEYNTKIAHLQRKLLSLYQDKQKYTKNSGQTALFGATSKLSLTTDDFKKMSVPELRAFTLQYYLTHLKGKKVALKNFIKEVVFTTKAGRKIAHGEAMYKEKAVVIEHLEELIKNSTYNNWGDRKPQDNENILGYLNFKSKLIIDGEKRHIRIAVILDKNRNFELKSFDVGKKKNSRASKGTLPSAEEAQLFDRKTTKNSEKTKQKPKKSGLGLPLTDEIRKKAFTEKGKLRKGWYYEENGLLTDGKEFYMPTDKLFFEYDLIEERFKKNNPKKEFAISDYRRKKVFPKEISKKIKELEGEFQQKLGLTETQFSYLRYIFTEYGVGETTFDLKKSIQINRNNDSSIYDKIELYLIKNVSKIKSDRKGNVEYQIDNQTFEVLKEFNKKYTEIHSKVYGNYDKLKRKYGLSAPETFSEETKTPSKMVTNERNLAQKLANRPTEWEFFRIDNPQMANFLGKVEKKAKDSVVITLTGGQGSGKTRFAFQFINDLAQNYKVGHISNEEQPDSSLYYDKVQQYLNENALQNVEPYDVRSLAELNEVIQRNEIIVIDSFQKIKELDPKFEVDKDLRKKYNGKLFLVIFQQTSDGKMRGGSKSQFDGDIILFTEKFDDYRENYVYPDKNRYNSVPANELKYSIFEQRLLPSESAMQPVENQVENLTFDVIM